MTQHKNLKSLEIKDVFFLIFMIIIVFGSISIAAAFSVRNMQSRIDVLSEKVKVLEYHMKDNSGEHVYTSSTKETI